jgi:hypothetical protein
MNAISYLKPANYSTPKQNHLQKVRDIIDGYYPILPEGEYSATLTEWYTAKIHGGFKAILLFTIVDSGDHFETVVPRFYAVKRHKGKVGLKAGFVSKARGAFASDYYTMRPDAPRLRNDQIPMTKLLDKVFMITVGDVSNDSKQKEHIDKLKYSVVREIKTI